MKRSEYQIENSKVLRRKFKKKINPSIIGAVAGIAGFVALGTSLGVLYFHLYHAKEKENKVDVCVATSITLTAIGVVGATVGSYTLSLEFDKEKSRNIQDNKAEKEK